MEGFGTLLTTQRQFRAHNNDSLCDPKRNIGQPLSLKDRSNYSPIPILQETTHSVFCRVGMATTFTDRVTEILQNADMIEIYIPQTYI
jgi:hypothetical protein